MNTRVHLLEQNKRLIKCLKMVKDNIEVIERRSYEILDNEEPDTRLSEISSQIYNINQKAHEVKKIMNVYYNL